MFGIGSMELVVILIVAMIVLGPSKLPHIARSVGKAFGEFKKASNDLKRTIDHEVDRIEREEKTQKAKAELIPEAAPAPKAPVSDEVSTPPAAPSPAPGKDKA